jgi:hypothetical protein
MYQTVNPFHQDDEIRHEIWEMLVRRDIDAFVEMDWATHRRDFLPDNFMGIDAKGSSNPFLPIAERPAAL